MVKVIIVKIMRIINRGIMNLIHFSYPTFTIAKEGSSKPVGLIKANNPIPY